MKKFLLYIAIFFLAVIAIDILFGLACKYLNSHARGGDTASHYEITMTQTEPVIIMGSSRAIHHYDSKLLEDSLGMGVYNCGVDGNGILFQYGRLSMLLERYRPRVIIYDAIPVYDISGKDVTRELLWMRRWYGHSSIDSLIADISPVEPLKLTSSLYRYNGSFVQMLSDNIKPLQDVAYKGYKPLEGVIDYEPKNEPEEVAEWLPLKQKYFTSLVKLCRDNDIKLIVAYSPWYRKSSSAVYDRLTELCRQYDVPIIDYYGDTLFSNNAAYFVDPSHLNDDGARAYSTAIVPRLRQLINQ